VTCKKEGVYSIHNRTGNRLGLRVGNLDPLPVGILTTNAEVANGGLEGGRRQVNISGGATCAAVDDRDLDGSTTLAIDAKAATAEGLGVVDDVRDGGDEVAVSMSEAASTKARVVVRHRAGGARSNLGSRCGRDEVECQRHDGDKGGKCQHFGYVMKAMRLVSDPRRRYRLLR
jgi:hypothetical protein